jgi:hypothetical protein
MGHALVSQRLRIQRGNILHPLDEPMLGDVQAVFLLLLVFVAVFAGLARRLKVPTCHAARSSGASGSQAFEEP